MREWAKRALFSPIFSRRGQRDRKKFRERETNANPVEIDRRAFQAKKLEPGNDVERRRDSEITDISDN